MYVFIILPTHPDPKSVAFAPAKHPTSEKSTFCEGAHFPPAKKTALLRGRLAGRGRLVGSIGHRRIGGSIRRRIGWILIRRGVIDDRSSHRCLVRSSRIGHWRSRVGHWSRRVRHWSNRVQNWSGHGRIVRRSIVCCMDGSPGKGQKRKDEDFHHCAVSFAMFQTRSTGQIVSRMASDGITCTHQQEACMSAFEW
jgi:hypothetical protein